MCVCVCISPVSQLFEIAFSTSLAETSSMCACVRARVCVYTDVFFRVRARRTFPETSHREERQISNCLVFFPTTTFYCLWELMVYTLNPNPRHQLSVFAQKSSSREFVPQKHLISIIIALNLKRVWKTTRETFHHARMSSIAEQPPQASAQEGAVDTTITTAADAAEKNKNDDDVEMKEANDNIITTAPAAPPNAAAAADEEEEDAGGEKNEQEEQEEEKEKEEEQEEEREKYDPKEGPKILANVPDLPRNAALHMTEQQKYALRQQIASYAHICQQLLQLTHEAALRDLQMSARGEYDRHATHASSAYPREKQPKKEKPHKDRKTPASIFSNTGVYSVPGKVRWQPTTAQFERLEQLFAIDTTTPQRENLKQVTEELSALGPIQECNVYNWFQNKKARLKKREQDAARERMEEEMRAKADQYNAQQQQMGNLS